MGDGQWLTAADIASNAASPNQFSVRVIHGQGVQGQLTFRKVFWRGEVDDVTEEVVKRQLGEEDNRLLVEAAMDGGVPNLAKVCDPAQVLSTPFYKIEKSSSPRPVQVQPKKLLFKIRV